MAEDESETVLKGKVQSIMQFGAFVTLEDGSTGLVHISEISESYVKNVRDYLRVGQEVTVVELPTENTTGKKRLSIKKSGMVLTPFDSEDIRQKKAEKKNKDVPAKKDFSVQPPMFDEARQSESSDFGDKLARYMKLSEERLVDVKHQTENKRGGNFSRR